MAKSSTERVAKHTQSLKETGLKRHCVWLPDDEHVRENHNAYAKRLRKKYGTPLPTER